MTSPPAHLGRSSRDVSSWKVGRVALKRRPLRALAARQSHPTALGKFLTSVKEHRLQLDEDVEVNDARVVYPNDCFVLEVQHHHGRSFLLPFSKGRQALALAEVWKSGGDQLEFRLPCRGKVGPDSRRRFGTRRVDHVPSAGEASSIGCGFSAPCKKVQ